VPVELGAAGVVRIVEQSLTAAEQDALRRAADDVKRGIAQLATASKRPAG